MVAMIDTGTGRLKMAVPGQTTVRISGDPPGRELTQWLEDMPPKLLTRFVRIGVLDSTRAAGGTGPAAGSVRAGSPGRKGDRKGRKTRRRPI